MNPPKHILLLSSVTKRKQILHGQFCSCFIINTLNAGDKTNRAISATTNIKLRKKVKTANTDYKYQDYESVCQLCISFIKDS